MFTVLLLPEFEEWLEDIKDNVTRIRLNKRLDKASRGLLGDVKPVGGGDKSTQQADIEKAIKLAKKLQTESDKENDHD